MKTAGRYRVWIVSCADWQPQSATDIPPHANALEPAEEALMSAAEAGAYLEGFNQTAVELHTGHWAVMVPITVRYEGDLAAGGVVQCARYTTASRFDLTPPKDSPSRPSGLNTPCRPASDPSVG